MDQSIALSYTNFLMPADANFDTKHRLKKYVEWLQVNNITWATPSLGKYRDYLMTDYRGRGGKPLSAASTSVHLATIRGVYHRLMADNDFRQYLFDQTPPHASPERKKAIVDETIHRIGNGVHVQHSIVKLPQRQDVADDYHLRLTVAQAQQLLIKPGVDTLQGLRDTAMIALMLCTGIREGELVNLEVKDLRQTLGGELALHVRCGKGRKERLVPYGDLSWALVLTEIWLKKVGIEEGTVFRGFFRGGRVIRKNKISTRSIHRKLAEYPLIIDGQARIVRPHDLRRTYARRLYESGVDLVAIKDNLGHSHTKTTLGYIGEMDVSDRQPGAVFHFDLTGLLGE